MVTISELTNSSEKRVRVQAANQLLQCLLLVTLWWMPGRRRFRSVSMDAEELDDTWLHWLHLV